MLSTQLKYTILDSAALSLNPAVNMGESYVEDVADLSLVLDK